MTRSAAPSTCPAGTQVPSSNSHPVRAHANLPPFSHSAFPWTNITKAGSAAIALEDSEYPAWLWALAPAPGGAAKKAAGGEESIADQVKRLRKDGAAKIKAANTLKSK